MKSLFFALFILISAANAEELKSKVIQKDACELIAENYPEESDPWDFEIEDIRFFYIYFSDCMDMKTRVHNKEYKKIGSKSYLKNMLVEFTDGKVICELRVERNINVTLNDEDEVKIIKSDWFVEEYNEPMCKLIADNEFEKFDFFKQSESKIKLKKIKKNKLPKNILVPDSLELGEPDDGTVGYDYYAHKAYKGKKHVGYILEYWYANSEGEWANLYILKYTTDGLFLNHLIDSTSMNYEEYPFFDNY